MSFTGTSELGNGSPTKTGQAVQREALRRCREMKDGELDSNHARLDPALTDVASMGATARIGPLISPRYVR